MKIRALVAHFCTHCPLLHTLQMEVEDEKQAAVQDEDEKELFEGA